MYQGYYNVYNPYYGYFNNYRATEEKKLVNDEIISLNEAIKLIQKSVGNEKEDEMFYSQLLEKAPTEKEKHIIRSIRDDEIRHNKMLKDLYKYLTGNELKEEKMTSEEIKKDETYKQQLERALMGEVNAVVKYRRIMGAMPDDDSYTTIMAIMTDELRHANKYNYLITVAA